jgi:hypothetical protein
MNFLLKTLIITMVLIMTKNANAQIQEIDNINSLLDFLKQEHHKYKNNILMIFDIDYVLIIPEDAYSMNRNLYRKTLWTEIKKNLSAQEAKLLHSIVTSDAKWKLVDNKILELFEYLKQNTIKTIGLTSLSTGRLGVIENREDLRQKELQSVGINFLELDSFKGFLKLDDFETEDGIPTMKHGVIFTAEQDKAIILEEILRQVNYRPDKIVFIDDMIKNLISLENMCKKMNIDFDGLHYTAVSKMPPPICDEKKEKMRLNILKEQKKWLVD